MKPPLHPLFAMILLGHGGAALAQIPLGPAFTYQGELKQDGNPANGDFVMEFTLWDDPGSGSPPTGGNQIGPALIFGDRDSNKNPRVEVHSGLFMVSLDFGAEALDGTARWLQIVVEGTPLSPRQPLTAAPYSTYALAAPNGHALDAADGGPAEALFVNSEGWVGIGTTHPFMPLTVVGSGPTADWLALTDSDGLPRWHMSGADGGLNFARTGVADGRLFLSSGGNIGIGTLSPAARLHVNAGTDVSPAAGGYLELGPFDGVNLTLDTNEIMARNNGQSADLHLNAEGGDVLVSALANSGGSLAIRTADPEAALHVLGDVRADDGEFQSRGPITLHPDVDDTGEGVVRFVTSAGNETMRVHSNGFIGIGIANPNMPLTIRGAGADSQWLQLRDPDGQNQWHINRFVGGLNIAETGVADARLLIAEGGNVGIGIAAPPARLSVDGDVRIYDGDGVDRAGLAVMNGQGTIYGDNVAVTGVKNFCIPHPNDPTKELWYACIEGPEAAIYARGTARLQDGRAVISLPEHFRAIAVVEGMTVHLTPLSAESRGLAVALKRLDGIVVRELMNGTGTYDFDWEVKAVRAGQEHFQVVRPLGELSRRSLPQSATPAEH